MVYCKQYPLDKQKFTNSVPDVCALLKTTVQNKLLLLWDCHAHVVTFNSLHEAGGKLDVRGFVLYRYLYNLVFIQS